MADVYGAVQSERDITRVNEEIRQEMEQVRNQWDLTQLKHRSDYLCKLACQPTWRRRFGDQIAEAVYRRAIEENRRTAETANRVAREHGWTITYWPWQPLNLDIGGSERPG